MADRTSEGYDTSIGTEDRSVRSATKLWGIILGLVALAGIIMIAVFMSWGSGSSSSGPVSSENTAKRPAEP
jgi:hypothetical protein